MHSNEWTYPVWHVWRDWYAVGRPWRHGRVGLIRITPICWAEEQ